MEEINSLKILFLLDRDFDQFRSRWSKVFKNTPNLAICIFWKCFSRNCVCYLKEKGNIKSFEIISKRKKFYRNNKKSLIVRSLIERITFGINLYYNNLNFFLIFKLSSSTINIFISGKILLTTILLITCRLYFDLKQIFIQSFFNNP